ncbi:serine/threonine-protein phosphatase PGAM5, mitochondrial-like [Tigriopus californicus]|nr:serine/threonine-protein phosphatase PGAM5, mitochondrial-like [Tigriopus californicus]
MASKPSKSKHCLFRSDKTPTSMANNLFLKGFSVGLLSGATGLIGYYFGAVDATQPLVNAQNDSGQPKWIEHEDPRIQRWDYNWDKRSPDKLVKPLRKSQMQDEEAVAERKAKVKEATPKSVRRVILIRHGQYDLSGQDDGQHHLTPLGFEQADRTGRRLAELLEDWKTNWARDKDGQQEKVRIRLYMSSMTRATETAQTILKHLPELDEVKSCNFIREGAPIAPVPGICKTLWNPDPKDFLEEGARIEAGFRKYMHRIPAGEEDIKTIDILVCHGNVIRYFLCRAMQFAPDAWLRFAIHNASISVISLGASGRLSLRTFGEIGHMPTDMMTFN